MSDDLINRPLAVAKEALELLGQRQWRETV